MGIYPKPVGDRPQPLWISVLAGRFLPAPVIFIA